MTSPRAAATSHGPGIAFGSVAIVLLALNLRPGASSLGPVLAEVQADLGMSSAAAGVLTALPGLAFGVFGVAAAWLGLRIGLAGSLALGGALATIGLLARSFVGGVPAFFLFSAVAFTGMAIGNVLVPAYVKTHFRSRTAALMSAYAVALSAGATGASLLSAPLAAALPGGWRASLGGWGVAAGVALIPWLWLAWRERRDRAVASGSTPAAGDSILSVARSRKAVGLAVFLGMQSVQAYVQFGWMAQMLRDGGLDAGAAGAYTSITVAFGIPAGLVMPWVAGRVRDGRAVVWVMALLLVAGWAGILWAPTAAPLLWSVLLGLAGFAFPYALALMTERTRDPRVTTRVSGFSQSVGYLLSALGPLMVGVLFGVSGGRELPLYFMLGTAVLFLIGGLVAASPGYVDDELAAASR